MLFVHHRSSGQRYDTHVHSSDIFTLLPITTQRQLQAYIMVIICDMNIVDAAWGMGQRGEKIKTKTH